MMLRLGALLLLFCSTFSHANSSQPMIGYYGLEPEIVTNYVNSGRRLGFIRIGVDLMLKDANQMSVIEYHAPLIRSSIIDILGQQPAERIKSTTGREEIRTHILEELSATLKQQTGQDMVAGLLFTKYIYE